MGLENCFRGMIHRVQPNIATRQRSIIQYEDPVCTSGALDWYEITKKVLGSGYFGEVKVAKHLLTGVYVAIKTLKKKQYADAGMQYPPKEVDLMLKLRHPNIFRFFHCVTSDSALYMISEVVSGGELFDYVAQNDHLSETESRSFMRQIVSAVDYMHRSGICHRDLKLENILLDAYGNIKLIDFGLGNFFSISGNALLSTFCGSPDYAPPEVWLNLQYQGPEIDVWALGVILFVMITSFVPFNNSSNVIEMRYQWPSSLVSDELKDMVGQIFRKSKERCNLDAIINHPWMNDNGKIEPIPRHPLFEAEGSLNVTILSHMELLGLPRTDVERDVLNQEHNQLSTTYALLEFELEEHKRIKNKSGASSRTSSDASSPLSGSPSDSPLKSPIIQAPSARNGSLRDSQKKCIIC
jgi:serine/threonine protein kinase